jgi:DNA-binding MarR family transcriptional regulator
VTARRHRDAVRTLARISRLLERGCDDLTLPQYRLLAMVAQGDERSSLLAERLAVAKPTITAMVDGLVERGLLTRSDVPGDRRAVRIAITTEGRKALDITERAMADRLAGVLGRVDGQPAVLDAIEQLGVALDAAVAERIAAGAAR